MEMKEKKKKIMQLNARAPALMQCSRRRESKVTKRQGTTAAHAVTFCISAHYAALHRSCILRKVGGGRITCTWKLPEMVKKKKN